MNTIDDVHLQFAGFFNSPALAPFAYLLSKRMEEGHICIDTAEPGLYNGEIPFTATVNKQILQTLDEWVANKDGTTRPFVLHKNRLYLQRYFNYETQILMAIARLLEGEAAARKQRQANLLKISGVLFSFKADYPTTGLPENEKTDWQMVAALQGICNNFTIITGGPGTGKTTTVAKILALLFCIEPGCKVALAAPTGKAAMRMADSLKQTTLALSEDIIAQFKNLVPNTIQRLLGYIKGSLYFRHHLTNPLPYDVVIVDEASMIDVALFAKLMDALAPATRLILLGDNNQLASVEAGSLLGDLCKSVGSVNTFGTHTAGWVNQFIQDIERRVMGVPISSPAHPLSEHIVALQRSHRFNSMGGIGKFSKAILQNDIVLLKQLMQPGNDPSVMVDTSFNTTIFEKFIDGYRDYLLEEDIQLALQKLNRLRVLCAVKDGTQGIYAINRAIEKYLQKQQLLQPDSDFYENRPIIITKNYPELHLFNGDVGIVRKGPNGNIRAWFEDSEKKLYPVMPGYIPESETVFAMTIHKSQGSEFADLLVLLPGQQLALLTRELLYTAVTRAREKVVVQSTEAILLQTCNATVQRASGIVHRFDEIQ